MHWKCHIFCKRVRKEIEGMNPLVFWSAIPLNPIQSYCFLSHCPIHWLTSNSDCTEKCIDLEHRAGDIKFFSLSTNPMKIPKPTENWFHRCDCNDIYLLQICMFFSFAHDRCVCVCVWKQECAEMGKEKADRPIWWLASIQFSSTASNHSNSHPKVFYIVR